MEEVKRKTSKKKIILNVIFYLGMAFFYTLVIIGVISRFNDGGVYLFSSRYDVVLTSSMASKNEAYLEFLQGTSQIQRNDVVRSKKINDSTSLELKDIVLFKNPSNNNLLTVHRIVEVLSIGDYINYYDMEKVNILGNTYISFNNTTSYIISSKLDAKSFSISSISLEDVDSPFICRFDDIQILNPTISKSKVGEYYHYEYSFTRGDTKARNIHILPNLSKQYISSIHYDLGGKKDINVDPNTLEVKAGEVVEVYYNFYDLYRTRGDASDTIDGTFSRNDLIAKVENVIPKIGIIFKFITSIYGIITFALVAVIISLGTYFYDRKPKTIKETSKESNENIRENNNENNEENSSNSNSDKSP